MMLCAWHETKYPQRPIRKAVTVLAAIALLVALSIPAFAAGGQTGDLTWSLSGGTLRISGSGEMLEYTDANMPPWLDVSDRINRIVVGEGVTSVGSLAFYNCSKVTAVSLPSTITSLGDRSFKFCRALTYIRFPAGLKSIGEAAFEHCESLNGFVLPNGLVSIGDYAFDRCVSLSHLTIPASITQLGRLVFHCCTTLTQVVIECPIEKLPDCIFYGCGSLYVVSLPNTVKEIGENAFHSCSSLACIYYSGDNAEIISEALTGDSATQSASVLDGGSISSFNGNIYISNNSGVNTAVSSTENAAITKTLVSSYDYTINGTSASIDEVLSAEGTDDITAVETSKLTLNAVIHNSEGWNEVTRAASTTLASESLASTIVPESPDPSTNPASTESPNSPDLSNGSDSTLSFASIGTVEPGKTEINIQLENSEVTSRELAKMAGEDITLNISTQNGSTWSIDESEQTRASYKQAVYNLDYSVTTLEDNMIGVKSEMLYSLQFNGDTDFKATVGVPLKVGAARKTATLYQKNGKEIETIQSVIVDDSGTAWFPLANVDSRTEYYVAINAAGVDAADAVIPQTLAKDYGMDSTLMGMDGNHYRITGRSSRWGITGGQFAIYVAIGIGTIVLVVSLAMITRNKLTKSKARYALADSEEEIDEDALRLEIMKELLDESNRKE